jgi:ADP-ribosylglycohydrolase
VHDVLDPRDLVTAELAQCRESGRDLAQLEPLALTALETGSGPELARVLDLLADAPRLAGWAHDEPSTLTEIEAVLPQPADSQAPSLGDEVFVDRVRAAWLGRCAGCVLGKPVEGWSRDAIRSFLQLEDAYPLADYFPQPGASRNGFVMRDCWPETTRGGIEFVARDDDIDYTILGLHVLEEHGAGFGPADVGREWLDHLPFSRVYTAERAAYRNLLHGFAPPETATHRNPYREWIGAQIRADIWGYVSPGQPRRAARLAFQDASLSHTANGIYGAMWAAGLIAICFVATDLATALQESLSLVPPSSRLADALRLVLDLRASGLDWESARDRLETELGHYSFVHTVNNAAAVAAALAWGEDHYTSTIGLAVQAGWDTDCNGATAGSAFGAMHGTAGLPASWTEPLNDHIRSAIFDFDHSRISELAERTAALRLGGVLAPTG